MNHVRPCLAAMTSVPAGKVTFSLLHVMATAGNSEEDALVSVLSSRILAPMA